MNLAYKDWLQIVTTKLSHLSKPQAVVLAMWTFAMVMTGSCGLTTVSVFLATVMRQKENTVRQRLKESISYESMTKGIFVQKEPKHFNL